MTRTIDVVLVDDHPLFSAGLELLLHAEAGDRVRVVDRTDDAARAAAVVRRAAADVALVDLAMPAPGGLHAIEAIGREAPAVRRVALSGVTDPDVAADALRRGASAFLPKSTDPADLVQPLLAVVEGWAVVGVELLRHLLDGARREGAALVDELDAESLALWRLLATGAGTQDIAEQLYVSERTAKRQVGALLRRIGCGTRAEAAALAGRSGLLDRPPPGSGLH